MSRTCYRAEIEAAARKYALPPDLVEAQVVVESAGYADAFRVEMGFFEQYMRSNPAWGFAVSNPRRFSASYGLLQCLYVTAYELGFRDEPEALFRPTVGLEWGCRKLAALVTWAKSSGPTMSEDVRLRAALASYNGGKKGNTPDNTPDRNAGYADRVMKMYARPR